MRLRRPSTSTSGRTRRARNDRQRSRDDIVPCGVCTAVSVDWRVMELSLSASATLKVLAPVSERRRRVAGARGSNHPLPSANDRCGVYGCQDTSHIVPRPLRLPAVGSSVMARVPSGLMPMPNTKAKPVGTGADMLVMGWFVLSHGRSHPLVAWLVELAADGTAQ